MAQARHPQQQQQQPPASQFSAQPFSPPVSSPSPHAASPLNGGPAPPPSKKPRLSPIPPSQSHSPYASPNFGAMQLPQNQPSMNGATANSMPSTPAGHQAAPPPAAPGTMGPPSVPPSRPVDAADLTDVLTSSGIDVREEEAFLTRSFSGPNAQAQAPQRVQSPAVTTSFASQASTTGTLSASSSFTEVKPAISQDPLSSQPPAPFKDPNEPTREDTQAARRAQYPLQECFLLSKALEQRVQKRGFELGVRIPSEGLFHPIPSRPSSISVMGPDGSSIVRTGQTILNQEGAPLVDILNLMSLSCEERLRGVIDYSAALARSRRAHSQGVPPPEYRDLAQPLGPIAGNATTPAKREYCIIDQTTLFADPTDKQGLMLKPKLPARSRSYSDMSALSTKSLRMRASVRRSAPSVMRMPSWAKGLVANLPTVLPPHRFPRRRQASTANP